MGNPALMRKEVANGLIKVHLEVRSSTLFTEELCCVEEVDTIKQVFMPTVTTCLTETSEPSILQPIILQCILSLRSLVEKRRTSLIEDQLRWNGEGGCSCKCRKAARGGICLPECKIFQGRENCCPCPQECKESASLGFCSSTCQHLPHGNCCYRSCEWRCQQPSGCPNDCLEKTTLNTTSPSTTISTSTSTTPTKQTTPPCPVECFEVLDEDQDNLGCPEECVKIRTTERTTTLITTNPTDSACPQECAKYSTTDAKSYGCPTECLTMTTNLSSTSTTSTTTATSTTSTTSTSPTTFSKATTTSTTTTTTSTSIATTSTSTTTTTTTTTRTTTA